jgi:hypothetical protein
MCKRDQPPHQHLDSSNSCLTEGAAAFILVSFPGNALRNHHAGNMERMCGASFLPDRLNDSGRAEQITQVVKGRRATLRCRSEDLYGRRFSNLRRPTQRQ